MTQCTKFSFSPFRHFSEGFDVRVTERHNLDIILVTIRKLLLLLLLFIIIIKVKTENYMFQAIKINNYQNLLATKNNRTVTFIINQFKVSICSSTFLPCISPDKTLRILIINYHYYYYVSNSCSTQP